MTLNELEIIERTAQAKCGKRFIVTLDPLRETKGHKMILIRVQDKEDEVTVLPCVMMADSTMSEICEIAEVLVEDLIELDS